MKKKAIVLACLTLVVLAVIFYYVPVEDCENTACQLGEAYPLLIEAQGKVARDFNPNEGGKQGFSLGNSKALVSGYVTERGSIVLVFRSGSVLIAQRTTNSNAKVEWKCDIYPEKFNALSLVKSCGSIGSDSVD